MTNKEQIGLFTNTSFFFHKKNTILKKLFLKADTELIKLMDKRIFCGGRMMLQSQDLKKFDFIQQEIGRMYFYCSNHLNLLIC